MQRLQCRLSHSYQLLLSTAATLWSHSYLLMYLLIILMVSNDTAAKHNVYVCVQYTCINEIIIIVSNCGNN